MLRPLKAHFHCPAIWYVVRTGCQSENAGRSLGGWKYSAATLVAASQWEQWAYASSCIAVISRKSITRAACLALIALALAGCADLFGTSPPDPATQMPLLEQRIAAMVAEQRAKASAKARALQLDPELTKVAKKRAAAMASANAFSTGDDQHISATMIMNDDAKFQGLVGENVAAQHFTPDQGIDVDAFAKRFVDGWAASKPHLENLSFPDYDRTGVGASANADTIYVAQIFTTDLGLGDKTDKNPPEVQTVPTPQDGKDGNKQADKGPALRGAIGGGPQH